ncbi:MAG: histidine phosphatase family protein [Solirubrobacteraceae bacterium]
MSPVRLLLVRHGTTTATRAAAFPTDEPLDERGRAEAQALRPHLPRRGATVRSPTRRAAETADALGHPDATVVDALREASFGSWAGRDPAAVHAEDPAGMAAWMTDPTFAPPGGGESLTDLTARVGGWLGGLTERTPAPDGAPVGDRAGDVPSDRASDTRDRDHPIVAITHGGVVRAAVVAALGLEPGLAWRIDVSPASITELHAHDGRWRLLRANWTVPRETRETPGERDDGRSMNDAAPSDAIHGAAGDPE